MDDVSTAPLGGVRILDLTTSIGGAFCTKLLADLGAEVAMVEPPGGSGLRSDLNLFEWLGAGKTSLSLPAVAPALARLAGHADAVVTSYPDSVLSLASPEIAEEVAAATDARPDLVSVQVSAFGASGPYRDWEASEIVEWALGGYMYFGGRSDRAPLLLPGNQAQLHGGMQAAFALLVGLHHARATGQGQRVEVSDWEAVLTAHYRLSVAWSHLGEVWTRWAPGASGFMRCADGAVFVQRQIVYNQEIFELIGRPELVGDERWATPEGWLANADELWAEVERWTSTRPVADVVALAQARRIAASPVNTLADVARSEQLAARNWVVELPDGRGGTRRLPGTPSHMPAARLGPHWPAPALGSHDRLVLDGGLGWDEARPASPSDSTPEAAATASAGALSGLRVLELTANWAGPLTGRLFGDLGAEVVKIEWARRPATRVSNYAGNEPGKYPYNRSGYFNKMNRNKLGVSLDVSVKAGRDVFLNLIAWADVFVENYANHVLESLRITYDDLRAVNPRLVMVCESGFGLTGPHSHHAAYGTNIEVASGLASLLGYEPGEQFRTGSFYADPIGGTFGAIAAMAALWQRGDDGPGQLVDLSLLESMAAFLGGYLTDVLQGGDPPGARGNRDARWAPQGCYRCVGDDMWVAISARDDAEWQALCRVMDRDDLARRSDLRTVEGRQRHHDDLDDAIAGWTTTQDHREAAQRLQDAGVPAGPVLKNWELLSDLHLFERGFYISVPHPETGVFPYPGFPWKFSATPGAVRRPAPGFAEHNGFVYQDLLGLSDEDLGQLAKNGVIDTTPQDPLVRVRAGN